MVYIYFSTIGEKKTHLCWIWLFLVQLSVQASRIGWDGSSPPLPPLSQRRSESRHKSLQRWCRHLEPRESINPVDQHTTKPKTGDSFILFFSLLLLTECWEYSYWLKFWPWHGSKLTTRWHLTFSISNSKYRKWNLWACVLKSINAMKMHDSRTRIPSTLDRSCPTWNILPTLKCYKLLQIFFQEYINSSSKKQKRKKKN